MLEVELDVQHVARQAQALKLLVRHDERQRARLLVALAALEAHETVLDHVDAAKAVAAHDAVERRDEVVELHALAVDRDRQARLEADDHVAGLVRRLLGVDGDRPGALGGLVPRVLEHAALDGSAPHVLVNRVRRRLGGVHGDAVRLGVLDLGAARGEVPAAHGAKDVERGVERLALELEAHLVVALAGAAVGHRHGTLLLGHPHEVAADGRARQGAEQRVLVLVHTVGVDGLGHEVLAELVADVDVVGGDGTERLGLVADGLDVGALGRRLAKAGDARHHVIALVLQVLEQAGGVEATGVRENDLTLFGHVRLPWLRVREICVRDYDADELRCGRALVREVRGMRAARARRAWPHAGRTGRTTRAGVSPAARDGGNGRAAPPTFGRFGAC